MTATVSNIVDLMNKIAPPHLCEKWDNVGLQLGHLDWPVKKVLVALDPSPQVIQWACTNKADMVITHHPLLFKPLKFIDLKSSVGNIIKLAIENKLAVFSAHTNLDSVKGGVGDILASTLGLNKLSPLTPGPDKEIFKLSLFAPKDHEKQILDILFTTEAGRIGNYSCCSFIAHGTGTYRPETGSNPYLGEINKLTRAEDVKIEILIPKHKIASIMEKIKQVHPYETIAYDIYPLLPQGSEHGIGRVGEFSDLLSLFDLAGKIKKIMGIDQIKVAGKPGLMVKKAAICPGSGSSMMGNFFASGAQVFISGDLHYHDARNAEDAGLGLIDLGHFESEHIIVNDLVTRLNKETIEAELDIKVESCDIEKSPFRYF